MNKSDTNGSALFDNPYVLGNKNVLYRLIKPFTDGLSLGMGELKQPWFYYFDARAFVRGPGKNQPL